MSEISETAPAHPTATYVLVHGGGHGGWCYQRVARILRAAGHEVHCPTLTGLGERSHLVSADVDLDTHITDVVNVLVYEDLRDVILAGHSYGGMVITGVADRALERIGELVYLDAALPLNGESLVDVSPTPMAGARTSGEIVDGVELVTPPDYLLAHMGVTDPDDLAWMRDRVSWQPWKCFEQPLAMRREADVKRIPRTIVNCTPTLGMDMQAHKERLFDADRVWEIDTGHDLMITEPDAVAEMLERLARDDPR
jgi:pimeloyl-ACP methyl ester carboxylesterase